jgi:gluconokinase|tara:strand:- start:34120 stop:34614 length:495 start_codon:yes stop_codon:yes gene_type:complete
MGVAGSGKTTVGTLLAERHGGVFHDADDFHPQANVDKMAQGHPLTDDDRLPWLQRLRQEVINTAPEGKITLLACSALKQTYREILGLDQTDVSIVYLAGDLETLVERINIREDHYMKPGMLASQLETLEAPSPEEALHISIRSSPEEIVTQIESALFQSAFLLP